MLRFRMTLVIAVFGALVAAAVAVGQSPVVGAYGNEGGVVQQGVAGASTGGGSLPFTGLDLTIVALAAVGLIAAGFAARRATRTQS